MLQEGSQFGPYQLIKRIAYGGMAEIHLAKATGLGGFEKLLALKVIHPKYSQDQEFIDMLIDEAKIAVQLSHVNIGQIFDLGRIDSTYYIAMEFIDGKDLYQLLVKCSEQEIEIPFDVIAFIAMELAGGLSYAHTKSDNYGRPLNLIHRDVSPQNILISFDGEVKLVDFGIAKASQRSRETESGVIKGKFFYMSPEQAWGDPVDARTDVFSAGICLYEMITGEMLYHEEKALILLDKVRKAEIPNMRERRAGLPPELEAITLRALARERERRFQTAAELQGALSAFLYRNWPGFNRLRVAEFLRGVIGDQRFVMPMPPRHDEDTVPRKRVSPPAGNPVVPRAKTPEPPRPKAPEPARPKPPEPARPKVEPPPPAAGSTDQLLMRAGEFVAQEHSVIFDLRSQRVRNDPAAPTAPPAPSAEFDDNDGDRTVAGAWYPGMEKALGGYPGQADDEDAEEATITEAVWANNQTPAEDEDTTAILEGDTAAAVNRIAVSVHAGEPEEPTALFNRPPDPPPRPRRDPAPTPQARPVVAEPPPTRAMEAPVPPRPVPPRAQTPPKPQPPAPVKPAPAVETPVPKAAPRPKPDNRSPETGRPTLHVAQALKRAPALKRLGRWLITPAGITVVVLVGLAAYTAASFLPTILSKRAPVKATLVLDSVPRGAHVTLDGQDAAQVTPATLPDLSTGANHTVVLELAGYEKHTETLNISPEEAGSGGEVKRRIFLKQATGTLHVTSEPVGAEVYLDGKFVGETPITSRNMDRNKERFLLLLRKDGFREEQKAIEWRDQTDVEVNVKLSKRGE